MQNIAANATSANATFPIAFNSICNAQITYHGAANTTSLVALSNSLTTVTIRISEKYSAVRTVGVIAVGT